MLSYYLKTSIEDIENLIELTSKDILDVKEANHESVFIRRKIKNDLVKSFENKKAMIDNELNKLANSSKNKHLEEILNSSVKNMLEEMKNKLFILKEKNREYARLVVTVSEFYNSLLDSIFPRNIDGYQRLDHKSASLLKGRTGYGANAKVITTVNKTVDNFLGLER